MQSKLLGTGRIGPIPVALMFLIPLAILYDLSLIYLFQSGKKYRTRGDFLSNHVQSPATRGNNNIKTFLFLVLQDRDWTFLRNTLQLKTHRCQKKPELIDKKEADK